MPTYKAPLDDVRFVLNEVFDIGELARLPGHEEHTPDLIDAVLGEAAKVGENVLQPLNRTGDEEGCRLENGVVTTPKGFKEAYAAFREGGWTGLACDPDYGGQGLPHTVQFVMQEFLCSANLGFELYPSLSHGAYNALHRWGSQELKDLYLPKIVDGTWSGTMCLTEPHCGTDLGLLRTKAVPAERRQLPHHRDQDLHLGRRARPDREHRAPRPGPAARRPAGHQGHQRCSSCRSSCPRPTARPEPATAWPAAPSSTRWGSRPRPPAS